MQMLGNFGAKRNLYFMPPHDLKMFLHHYRTKDHKFTLMRWVEVV